MGKRVDCSLKRGASETRPEMKPGEYKAGWVDMPKEADWSPATQPLKFNQQKNH